MSFVINIYIKISVTLLSLVLFVSCNYDDGEFVGNDNSQNKSKLTISISGLDFLYSDNVTRASELDSLYLYIFKLDQNDGILYDFASTPIFNIQNSDAIELTKSLPNGNYAVCAVSPRPIARNEDGSDYVREEGIGSFKLTNYTTIRYSVVGVPSGESSVKNFVNHMFSGEVKFNLEGNTTLNVVMNRTYNVIKCINMIDLSASVLGFQNDAKIQWKLYNVPTSYKLSSSMYSESTSGYSFIPVNTTNYIKPKAYSSTDWIDAGISIDQVSFDNICPPLSSSPTTPDCTNNTFLIIRIQVKPKSAKIKGIQQTNPMTPLGGFYLLKNSKGEFSKNGTTLQYYDETSALNEALSQSNDCYSVKYGDYMYFKVNITDLRLSNELFKYAVFRNTKYQLQLNQIVLNTELPAQNEEQAVLQNFTPSSAYISYFIIKDVNIRLQQNGILSKEF